MKLARVNTVLFVAIMAVVAYIVITPLVPAAIFWMEKHATSRLDRLSGQLRLPAAQVSDMNGERLVIPAMLLDTTINEGPDLRAARSGPWRRPHSSTPDNGSNTVIVAHRFTYTNPRGVFYYLNKVQLGDEIGVFWHGKRYMYKVNQIKTVPPTDGTVEAPSSDARLTLYTCTPLWLPKDRLVITAELEK